MIQVQSLSRVFDEHIGVEDVDVVEDMGGEEGRGGEKRGEERRVEGGG